MPIEKIIVLEDDLIVRKNLEQQLRQRRYDVASAGTIAAAQELLGKDNFDLIFVDVRLPDGEGTDLLRQLQARPQKPLVVIVTGFGSVESAVNCMRDGAFDYLIKPFSSDQIEVTLKKAEEFTQLLKVNRYLNHEEDAESGYELLGRSPAMDQLRALIRKVARTQATVLIQGESGTGKELVARAIYRESPRTGAPFIKVNCAAIPENLIESEFFGHEKGAFTGALNKREGRFELAHGGTILLDEVSEISPQVQAKLLRVLQERELERVGGNRTIKVDVRVLATTNRHLEQSVERKEFRQDLYFRLNVVPILVPPLRERREDIPLLVAHFLRTKAADRGFKPYSISRRALEAMQAHAWPGNVRELENAIERASALCEDGFIKVNDLPPNLHPLGSTDFSDVEIALAPSGDTTVITTAPKTTSAGSTSAPAQSPLNQPVGQLKDFMRDQESSYIQRAIAQAGGDKEQAAKALGVSLATLYRKLAEGE